MKANMNTEKKKLFKMTPVLKKKCIFLFYAAEKVHVELLVLPIIMTEKKLDPH